MKIIILGVFTGLIFSHNVSLGLICIFTIIIIIIIIIIITIFIIIIIIILSV